MGKAENGNFDRAVSALGWIRDRRFPSFPTHYFSTFLLLRNLPFHRISIGSEDSNISLDVLLPYFCASRRAKQSTDMSFMQLKYLNTWIQLPQSLCYFSAATQLLIQFSPSLAIAPHGLHPE